MWEGTEEKELSPPWVYVRTEIKERLQDAESIRKQEIRAKLTVNLTGILGTWFGLQRDTKWEFCAAHLCQVPEGQEVPANTWDTLHILPERSFFLSVMAFGSRVP